MEDSGALVTVAMLSTMLNEQNKEYLDIISPFVLSLLPSTVGEVINTDNIIELLNKEYGFEQFPIHVLTKILTRASKSKSGYLERKNGEFFVKKPYEKTKFKERQVKIRDAQSLVIQELKKYLQSNSRYKSINEKDTQEKFMLFLEKKGLSFVDGVDSLKVISSKDYDTYQVARFILVEYAKKSPVYYNIEEVVRGFFVYKTIYFFSKDNVVSLTEKMKNTEVYFDTPLLIELLGYNTPDGSTAAHELLDMVKNCGGHPKTFSHLIKEVSGILTAFGKRKCSRSQFKLQYLLDNDYNESDVIRLRTTFETRLTGLGIEIVDQISLTEMYSDEYEPLQINDLLDEIQNAYELSSPSQRTDNDVLSVASIYHLRGKARCTSLENCKAIMVTSNLGFSNTVNTFYKQGYTHGVGFVVSDIDLTAVLWLRSWDKRGSLPSVILLENAYAACQPTQELLSAFAETVEKLRGEGKITDDEALLLRTQSAPRDDLLQLSQNDENYVSEKTVLEIQERYAKSLTNERDGVIVELQEKVRADRKKEENRKRRAIEHAEEIAENEAQKCEKRLKIILKIFVSALAAFGVFALCYYQVQANINTYLNIMIIFIGIGGWIDFIRGKSGALNKLIVKARNKRFDNVHDKEIRNINYYFEN